MLHRVQSAGPPGSLCESFREHLPFYPILKISQPRPKRQELIYVRVEKVPDGQGLPTQGTGSATGLLCPECTVPATRVPDQAVKRVAENRSVHLRVWELG